MRRGFFLVLALLPVIPAGAAQSAAPLQPDLPSEHAFVVEGAFLNVVEAIDTQSMQVLTGTAAGCESSGGTLDDQPDDVVRPSQDGASFTFEETPLDPTGTGQEGQPYTGCAAVAYNVTFPASPDRIRVSFIADRQVQVDAGSSIPSLPQELRLRFEDGSIRIDPYFASREGSSEPRAIEREYSMPAGGTNVTLSWFFEDEGFDLVETTGDPGRATFRATVSMIEVAGLDIPLPNPSVAVGAELRDEEERIGLLQYAVNVTVPAAAHRQESIGKSVGGRSADVILEVRRGATLLGRDGPAGPVPNSTFEASRIGDRIIYVVNADIVAEQGPGTYTFRFATTRALPAPTPTDPTRILPFFYTMILLPAPAAALAVYSGATYRHEAEGRYRRAANGILAAILVAVGYYLLLVLYSLFVTGTALMTELPLDREATLVYVQLIVLLLFFAVTAVVVGRYLARAMRRDIEQRRLQEERLRRSNEELERFAYVASHDLQEPLRKVAGFTSLLQRRYKGRLDKDADEMIQYAVDGATRMQALIRDILAYSRVGSSELELKPVETAAVLELVVADLGERIKEEQAQVVWKDLPVVEADAGQLRQVLQNLVENGIKYRHPDRRPKVKVSAEPEGAFWHVSVSDNGVGIPADKLNEIFGIFRRLHGNEVPGTGIGLALVKKAVERHGGRVWAESRLGKGSTFHFTVPAAPDEASDRRAGNGAEPSRTPREGAPA